jgi:hypothetical protein
MAALGNLIPDPSTKNLFVVRPASLPLSVFAGFTTPGFISAQKTIGTLIYGMIASGLNAGKDQPFVYDTVVNAFIAITGITGANTPNSPNSSGNWTPPTMDLVGVTLIVTHPGFTGAGGVMFGWFDLTNPAAPVWHGGNTVTTALPSPPIAVKQFNSRAYYLLKNAAYFSDALVPLTITDPTHILTFGDSTPVTAVGALPLNNQLGGIIQALIVFKGAVIMYQITGDAAQNSLQVNAMNVATGTNAPNTICSTPNGLAFMAPDGFRLIDFTGQVSDPIGVAGDGITVPFIYALFPSRACAAFNGSVLRASVQNGIKPTSPFEEYWFDFSRKVWTGPHSFPASLINPLGNSFAVSPVGVMASLFQSDAVQSSVSTFVENGAQIQIDWKTSMLPNTQQMHENAMQETTINMALFSGGTTYVVTAGDQDGNIFDTQRIVAPNLGTIWGAFTWGSALWSAAQKALAPQRIPWAVPIIFQRLYLEVTGPGGPGFKIGNMHMKYEKLGYLQMTPTGN